MNRWVHKDLLNRITLKSVPLILKLCWMNINLPSGKSKVWAPARPPTKFFKKTSKITLWDNLSLSWSSSLQQHWWRWLHQLGAVGVILSYFILNELTLALTSKRVRDIDLVVGPTIHQRASLIGSQLCGVGHNTSIWLKCSKSNIPLR